MLSSQQQHGQQQQHHHQQQSKQQQQQQQQQQEATLSSQQQLPSPQHPLQQGGEAAAQPPSTPRQAPDADRHPTGSTSGTVHVMDADATEPASTSQPQDAGCHVPCRDASSTAIALEAAKPVEPASVQDLQRILAAGARLQELQADVQDEPLAADKEAAVR